MFIVQDTRQRTPLRCLRPSCSTGTSTEPESIPPNHATSAVASFVARRERVHLTRVDTPGQPVAQRLDHDPALRRGGGHANPSGKPVVQEPVDFEEPSRATQPQSGVTWGVVPAVERLRASILGHTDRFTDQEGAAYSMAGIA